MSKYPNDNMDKCVAILHWLLSSVKFHPVYGTVQQIRYCNGTDQNSGFQTFCVQRAIMSSQNLKTSDLLNVIFLVL